MDTLEITALRTKTRIGVYAWEQAILQELIIDIQIPIDCRQCDEQLEKTLDYDTLCQKISGFIESNAFVLIETVADKTAAFIKTHFDVKALTVRVSKPHAIANAGNISVTVTR
jgi:dihydroneopterin aldolase